MVSLDQIRLLESRVHKAVRRIESLQDENDTLRERLARYEKRIEELEVLINEFKESQSEIEQGIINALSQLDDLEDQVTEEQERITPRVEESSEATDEQAATGPTKDAKSEATGGVEADRDGSPDAGAEPAKSTEEDAGQNAELDIF